MARPTLSDISKEIDLKLPWFVPVRVHKEYVVEDTRNFDALAMKSWIGKILANQIDEIFGIFDGFVELFGYPMEFDSRAATIAGETIDVITETSLVIITCDNITKQDLRRAAILNVFSQFHYRSVCVYNPIIGIAWAAHVGRQLFREHVKLLETTYGFNVIMRPWRGWDITTQLSAFLVDGIVVRRTFEDADTHLRGKDNYAITRTVQVDDDDIFFEMKIIKNTTCVIRAMQYYMVPLGNITICGIVFIPITDEIATKIRNNFRNLYPNIV